MAPMQRKIQNVQMLSLKNSIILSPEKWHHSSTGKHKALGQKSLQIQCENIPCQEILNRFYADR